MTDDVPLTVSMSKVATHRAWSVNSSNTTYMLWYLLYYYIYIHVQCVLTANYIIYKYVLRDTSYTVLATIRYECDNYYCELFVLFFDNVLRMVRHVIDIYISIRRSVNMVTTWFF